MIFAIRGIFTESTPKPVQSQYLCLVCSGTNLDWLKSVLQKLQDLESLFLHLKKVIFVFVRVFSKAAEKSA